MDKLGSPTQQTHSANSAKSTLLATLQTNLHFRITVCLRRAMLKATIWDKFNLKGKRNKSGVKEREYGSQSLPPPSLTPSSAAGEIPQARAKLPCT